MNENIEKQILELKKHISKISIVADKLTENNEKIEGHDEKISRNSADLQRILVQIADLEKKIDAELQDGSIADDKLGAINQEISNLYTALESKAPLNEFDRLETQIRTKDNSITNLEIEIQTLGDKTSGILVSFETIISKIDTLEKYVNSEIEISLTSFQNRILLLEQKDVLLKKKISDLRQDSNTKTTIISSTLDNLSNQIHGLKEECLAIIAFEIDPIKTQQDLAHQDYKSLYNEYVFLHEQFKIIGELQTMQLKEKIEDIERRLAVYEAPSLKIPNDLLNKINKLELRVTSFQGQLYIIGLVLVGISVYLILSVVF